MTPKPETPNQEVMLQEDDELETAYGAADAGILPINKPTLLDNKIISSFGNNKLFRIQPNIEQQRIAVPYLDKKTGKPKMFKGVVEDPETGEKFLVKAPLLRKIKLMPVLDPKLPFTTEEVDFPIPKWFNDSITSTYLSQKEANFLRRLTDFAIYLFTRAVNNPEEDYTGMLWRLSFMKDMIADTGKSIDGRGIEAAKTNINRSESTVWRRMPEDDRHYEEFKKKKNAGLFASLKLPGKITM